MLFFNDVDSSAIKTIAYNGDEKKLWIRFQSDALYEYRDVEKETVTDLIKAESKGKHFAANIKNKFSYEKVVE